MEIIDKLNKINQLVKQLETDVNLLISNIISCTIISVSKNHEHRDLNIENTDNSISLRNIEVNIYLRKYKEPFEDNVSDYVLDIYFYKDYGCNLINRIVYSCKLDKAFIYNEGVFISEEQLIVSIVKIIEENLAFSS